VGVFDRVRHWLGEANSSDLPQLPALEEERVPLNPHQMIVAETAAKMMGWNRGITSLSREQYDLLQARIPSFQSLGEGYSNNSDLQVTASQVAAALSTLYTKATETRKAMVQEVDEISNFYMLEIIVSQVVDDALNPDITTDRIFELTSDKEHIQKELTFLEKTFRLDKLAKEIAPEFIRYGEYTLSTVVKTGVAVRDESVLESLDEELDQIEFGRSDTGLVQLNDNVDQTEVVAITKNSETDYYINVTHKDGKDFLQRRHRSAYVQFRLDQQRVRIDLHKEFNYLPAKQKEQIGKLPRFVRVGQSFIHSMIPKFRELELLEKLAPATKLSKLSSGTLIGMQVPEGYTLEKALNACKTVEGIINRKVAIQEDTGRISVESILTAVGRSKVVPIFGETGNTKVMETKSDDADNLAADVQNLRKVILDGIGVPYELIFSAEAGDKKGDVLKRYSRYLRKLKSVQRAVKDGLVQIATIHLAAKGIPFNSEDIKVNFFNKLIELDNLDKLEFLDGSISLLGNTRQFVQDLLDFEQFSDNVDVEAFVIYLKDQLRLLGLEDLVIKHPDRAKLSVPAKPAAAPEGEPEPAPPEDEEPAAPEGEPPEEPATEPAAPEGEPETEPEPENQII
jgi:hypothetical protein